MPGALKLLRGDLFDGPSDLIVIPCTTAGGLTRHAEKRLADYRIPRPPGRLDLGGVAVLPFSGAKNIAQFVAYAATAGAATPLTCIEDICRKIGEETARNRIISRVVAPLIGVGAGERAGQLESALRATRRGFLATSVAHAVLTLHVANGQLFYSASRWFAQQSRPREGDPQVVGAAATAHSLLPRVFISCTKTSDDHAKRL